MLRMNSAFNETIRSKDEDRPSHDRVISERNSVRWEQLFRAGFVESGKGMKRIPLSHTFRSVGMEGGFGIVSIAQWDILGLEDEYFLSFILPLLICGFLLMVNNK